MGGDLLEDHDGVGSVKGVGGGGGRVSGVVGSSYRTLGGGFHASGVVDTTHGGDVVTVVGAFDTGPAYALWIGGQVAGGGQEVGGDRGRGCCVDGALRLEKLCNRTLGLKYDIIGAILPDVMI